MTSTLDSRPDTGVRYDVPVTGGTVDRKKWAAFIEELLGEMPRRNKRALGRLTGFSERTIDRWLARSHGVDESSVRQVAERTGRNPIELLIRVGVYGQDEMPPPAIQPEDQWIVDVYNASSLDPATRQKLLAVELANAQRDREEKRRRIEQQLELLAPSDTRPD